MAMIAYQRRLLSKAPRRIRNSPTKPLVPGRPIDDRVTIMKMVAKIGIRLESPPKSADQPGMAALIDKTDDEEERPGGNPVVEHLQHPAATPCWLRAKMPSMTKPRWATDE